MTRLRVATKISLLGGACAIIALTCAVALLWWTAANAEADERAYRAALRQVELARVMQIDFKKQVQEWKDVLLRGHVPADRDRYVAQFRAEESNVRANGQALLATLSDPAAQAAAQRFLSAHESLGRQYRQALGVFIASGGLDYQGADRLVRGMDRGPTDLIDDLVEIVKKQEATEAEARHAAGFSQREITMAIVAALAIGLIGASIWMSRRITAPILDLTAIMSQVAQTDDYSLRARPTGDNELRRLAEVFNQMLGRLEQQTSALQQASDNLQQQLEIRRQSEAKLADSLSLLNATIESTTDGLLVVDRHDGVTLVNGKFARMWRIPPEMLAARDDRALVAYVTSQLNDPDGFVAKVRQLYAEPDSESFDLLTFKDGRVFERSSQPQQVNGVTVGRVWSFRDVTERHQAEANLKQLNKDLLLAVRQAGMAEVATGVLHNVGNLLNSVNVASSTVADALKRSKSASLGRVVALLREHEADLGAFLGREGKGKQLVEYLAQLGEVFANEHAIVLKELAELQTNVEHTKEIVTRQQSFAKLSGQIETVDPVELLDEALRLNRSAFTRYGIAIERQVDASGSITTDKSQILQILVNLLRNAVQACAETRQADKRITARLGFDGDTVRFFVTDNGVGIAPDNLPKIFAYGFTTKKDGHGFGLHACARMARELGGKLTVESPAAGQGATFTLELPTRRNS